MKKRKQNPANEPAPVKTIAPRSPQKTRPSEKPKAEGKRSSKQDQVIAMLQSPSGTTITAVMKATGWQQHSVRGFFAGTVRKKLRLKLSSKKVDGTRVYRASGSVPSNTDRSHPRKT